MLTTAPTAMGTGTRKGQSLRECAHCKTIFKPRRSGSQQRFCSKNCHYAAARRPIPERFWEKVDQDGPVVRAGLTPCWPWRGTQNSNGYGLLGVGGSHSEAAHRIAWEIGYGSPPPDDMIVCHVCDYPLCVRNDETGIYLLNGVPLPRVGHLFLGTPQDNVMDMYQKGRSRSAESNLLSHPGEQNPAHKLTLAEVQEIRHCFLVGNTTITALGSKFGVSRSAVSLVVRGRTWGQS